MQNALEPLSAMLKERFKAPLSHGIEIRIALHIATQNHLILDIREQALRIESSRSDNAEVFLFFDSMETALGLFRGEISAVDAFMLGKFRSNGHLLMTFITLHLFSSS